MNENGFNKKQVIIYLIVTFGLGYLIQIGVWLLYQSGNAPIGQLVMALMMFVPMLGVLCAGHGLKQMGWNPRIKKNLIAILIAWLLPAVLTAAGAALYFLLFPGHFDLGGSYLTAAAGGDALAQLEAQGISYPAYILIAAVCAVTYAPLMNGAFALGEEIGWRGFLYPQLKARFGRRMGLILGGVIWGMWHWPIIWLIGYEYGIGYFGYPIVGMLLFCVITVAIGVLCDRLYEKSGSIWLPAICHGAINAAAGIPLMLCYVEDGSAILLGPAPNGLIAGLPLIVIAAILLIRGKDKKPIDTKTE